MSGFDRRVVAGVALFAAASFGLGLWASLTDQGPPRPAAHSRSRAAGGHHALVAMLRGLGVEVVVRRAPVAEAPGRVLLALSPDLRAQDPPVRAAAAARLQGAAAQGPVLVALPRFAPQADGGLAPAGDAAALLLEELRLGGRIVGAAGPVRWGPEPERPEPGGPDPTPVAGTWQLVEGSALEPVLRVGDGILLGRRGGLWVLSDGSLLSNQGLAALDNAAFAAWLLARVGAALPPGVVVDDALHGGGRASRLWAFVTEGDGGRLVGLGLATVILTLWAGAGRFGALRPDAPPHGEGRGALIEAVAGLAHAADHGADSLARLWELALSEVAAAAHAPAGGPAARCAWLDAQGPGQGRPGGAAALAAAVAQVATGAIRDPLPTARAIAAWRAAWLNLDSGATA